MGSDTGSLLGSEWTLKGSPHLSKMENCLSKSDPMVLPTLPNKLAYFIIERHTHTQKNISSSITHTASHVPLHEWKDNAGPMCSLLSTFP